MRRPSLRIGLPLILAAALAGLILWSQLSSRLESRAQSANQSVGRANPAPETSRIFTTAHRTALDAVRDFFNRHPQPVQPIAYTHKVHLANGMQCVNCHIGVDTGPDAVIPGVKFCMMCHQIIAADRPEIKKLAAYYQRGEDLPWQRVYNFAPEVHVRFKHAPHVRAGIDCKACHGDMTKQTVAVRAVNLTMGYCIDCHRQKKASVDCTSCHF